MEAKKASWRLKGLIGQMKSLRKAGVLTAQQELNVLKELQGALRRQDVRQDMKRLAESKAV